MMDSKRLHAFRDELYKIFTKWNERDENQKQNNSTTLLELDEIVSSKVGMSLFNQTSALGNLHTTWISELQLSSEMRTAYAELVNHGWEILSPDLEEIFASRLCYRLHKDDGALLCDDRLLKTEEQLANDDRGRKIANDESRCAILHALADEAHERLQGLGVPGLGRCVAVCYPLSATLPGPQPQRVKGVCHAIFCHGSDVTLVDFRCRRLALHATSDILRLSLYKALGMRIGLASPDRLHVGILTAYLEHERPRLRLWVYNLSKQMDEAVMSLDCLSQVSSLLQLHVTEVLT